MLELTVSENDTGADSGERILSSQLEQEAGEDSRIR